MGVDEQYERSGNAPDQEETRKTAIMTAEDVEILFIGRYVQVRIL